MNVLHRLVTAEPLLALFVTIALGYLVGKIKIGSFVLGGIAGTLLVGVIIGQLGVNIDSGIKNIFFALFIYAVGYQGGPQFFHALNRRSLNQLASAFVMCFVGLLCVLAAAWMFGLDRGMAAGLAAGGLTQSAIIGTAGDAITKLGLSPELTKTMQTNVAVGYAVCYIFGSLGPIIMVSWFLPLIMKWNIRQEAVKLAKLFRLAAECPSALCGVANRCLELLAGLWSRGFCRNRRYRRGPASTGRYSKIWPDVVLPRRRRDADPADHHVLLLLLRPADPESDRSIGLRRRRSKREPRFCGAARQGRQCHAGCLIHRHLRRRQCIPHFMGPIDRRHHYQKCFLDQHRGYPHARSQFKAIRQAEPVRARDRQGSRTSTWRLKVRPARRRKSRVARVTLNTNLAPLGLGLSPSPISRSACRRYAGWADAAIAPENGLNYYRKVTSVMGDVHSFYRVFMAPGMAHCYGGAGPNSFGNGTSNGPILDTKHDLLKALELWVERGIAPDKIIATKYFSDNRAMGVAMQRPLCPYPQISKYNEFGRTSDPSSFKCVVTKDSPDPRNSGHQKAYR